MPRGLRIGFDAPAVPTPPQPTLVSVTATSATINGVNPGSPAVTMHVYRDGLKITTGNGVAFGNYVVSGLSPATNYSITIAAVNAQGVESAQSAALSVTTGAPGSLVNGGTLTITGSGFGVKSPAAPLHFDNFEGGAAGAALTAGTLPTVGAGYFSATMNIPPRYDTTHVFSGTRSLLLDFSLDFTTQSVSALVGGLNNAQACYYSYRVRKWLPPSQTGTTTEAWNIKYARVGATQNFQSEAGAPGFDNFTELNGVLTPAPLNANIGQHAGVGSEFKIATPYDGPTLAADTWHRMESYMRLPSPFNTNTGERWFKLNGDCPFFDGGERSRWADPFAPAATAIPTTEYRGAAINTFNGASGNSGFNFFITPYYCRGPYTVRLWIDELYIDTTQARVEIGNNANFYACTKRSPQPPTAWSDNSITVTLNRGDMTPGEQAFVHVITANGTIISLGSVGNWQ